VDIFFDTTVLVAASERSHPHYAQAMPVVERVNTGKDKGFISVHSIAEVYASLTRLPILPRIHPLEAMRILADNIIPNFQITPIGKEDYDRALSIVGNGGWIGAKIYDALLLCCAAKCAVKRIYTFNLRDFQQLAPPDLQGMICTP
jgi:predicted nucleic acid-binding protein